MPKLNRTKHVMHWDDERDIDNGIIVTLKWGWRFTEEGEHVRGFDLVKEANAETVEPCECKECLGRQQ